MIELIGANPKWIDVLAVNMKGNFVDTITPGAKMGGEVARVYVLRKRLGISASEGTLIVGLQKSLSLLSFLTLSVLSLIWFYLTTNIQATYMMIFGIGLVFLIFLLVLLIGVSIFPDKIQKWIIKIPISGKLKEKLKNFLVNFYSAFQGLKKSKKNFIGQILLSTAIWLIFALKMYVIAHSLGISIDWLTLSAITYLTYMVGMIPLLPGSVGSFEGCMVGLLLLKGVEINTGMALTVLFRVTTFWFPFLLSLIYMGASEFIIFNKKKT